MNDSSPGFFLYTNSIEEMIAIKLIVISFRKKEKNIDYPQWERKKKKMSLGT